MQPQREEQSSKHLPNRKRRGIVYLAHALSLANFLFIAFFINRWGVVSQLVLWCFAVGLYVCILLLTFEKSDGGK